MIRKFAISFLSVLALPLSSYALSGGPFDNGDYGGLLDDQGIYQYAMRFKNGSGFAQFGNNVSLAPATSTTGGSSASGNLKISTNLDRSLVYYKGVTYYGNCSGMADIARRKIDSITNGFSDATVSSSSSSSGTTGTTAVSATSVLVKNGLNQPCNTQFTGVIYSVKPVLKFRGEGELTVIIAPQASSGATNINDTLYNAITAIINSIPTVAASNNSTVSATVTALQNFITAIPSMLTAVNTSGLTQPGSSSITYDTVHMTAYGSRRFFVSQR
jgi:hypothetical protein